MSNDVLFYMWEPFRQSVIAQHVFYVEQAKQRLLVQFSSLEQEENTNAFIDQYMRENAYRFDPEFHDVGDFYEEACERYQALLALGMQIRLSVVAGMYHEWDKQLKKWLVTEIQRWHTGKNVPQAIWKASFDQIMDMLAQLGWDIKIQAYYGKLNECRLVANVYKHGDGASFDNLRKCFPEYLPVSSTSYPLGCTNSTDLTVNITQLDAFSSAIVSFWENIPENIYDYDGAKVPNWLKRAFDKDA